MDYVFPPYYLGDDCMVSAAEAVKPVVEHPRHGLRQHHASSGEDDSGPRRRRHDRHRARPHRRPVHHPQDRGRSSRPHSSLHPLQPALHGKCVQRQGDRLRREPGGRSRGRPRSSPGPTPPRGSSSSAPAPPDSRRPGSRAFAATPWTSTRRKAASVGSCTRPRRPTSRRELRKMIDWWRGELAELPHVTVHLGTEISADSAELDDADEIIVATGSHPLHPADPGHGQAHRHGGHRRPYRRRAR